MGGRNCTTCGEWKPYVGNFQKRTDGKDGFVSRCSVCLKVARRKSYLKNHEKQRARQAEYRAANVDLIRQQQATWRAANKQELKRRNFEKSYNITWSEREQMLADQGGVCAICKSPDPKGPDWHMDHGHSCCPEKAKSCGECLRGLLCGRCNVGIGCFSDNTETMLSAIDYINKSSKPVSRMTPI